MFGVTRTQSAMETKAFYFVAFLLAAAGAAPPEKVIDIEDSEVGYYHQNTRIVGGENAPDGSVPWMAAMSTGTLVRSLVCGASLVSTRHLITAAHCIVAVRSCSVISGCSMVNSLRVHLGSNRFNRGDTAYRLQGNVTHPHYLHNIIKNDIGVLITSTAVVLTDLVQIVPLNFNAVDGGEPVMVSGWGRTAAGGSLPTDLKRVYLWTLGGQECIDRMEEFTTLHNVAGLPIEPHLEICTYHSIGQGTCNGDSGSALVHAETGQQVGAVSWGFPCALGAPDVFARISGFTDFLNDALNTL